MELVAIPDIQQKTLVAAVVWDKWWHLSIIQKGTLSFNSYKTSKSQQTRRYIEANYLTSKTWFYILPAAKATQFEGNKHLIVGASYLNQELGQKEVNYNFFGN